MAKRDPGPWSLEDQFKAMKNEIQKLWRETRRMSVTPGCHFRYRTNNTTLQDATVTSIELGTDGGSNDPFEDLTWNGTDAWTVNRDGWYLGATNIRFAANSTGRRIVGFTRSTVWFARNEIHNPISSGLHQNASFFRPLAAGDVIRAAAYQNSGGTLDLVGGIDNLWASIGRVR